MESEQPVGLVQHQPAHRAERDAQGVFDVIHQTSRGRDQDVDSFTEPDEKNTVYNLLKDTPSLTEDTPCHSTSGITKRGRGGGATYRAFSDFLFSPPIRTPGTIQVNGCRERDVMKNSSRGQTEAGGGVSLPSEVSGRSAASAGRADEGGGVKD